MKKKLFAWLLVLAMVMTLLPMTLPTANAADKQYISFGSKGKNNGWIMADSPYAFQLFKVENPEAPTVNSLVTSMDQIESGSHYVIFGVKDKRLMENWDGGNYATAQATGNVSGTVVSTPASKHVWIFTKADNGWYIMPNDGYYLTDKPYGGQATTVKDYDELAISETEKTVFTLEMTDIDTFNLSTGGEEPEVKTESRYIAYTDDSDAEGKYGWYISEVPYELKLYYTSNASDFTGTQITDIDDISNHEYFLIVAHQPSTARAMHNWNDYATAQCGFDGTKAGNAEDVWTIAQDDQGGYTISPANKASTTLEEIYLGQSTYVGEDAKLTSLKLKEISVSSTKTSFKIEKGINSGTFYLTWEVPAEGGDVDPGTEDDFDGFGTGLRSALFNNTDKDNTWVFTGGANVAGGFEQTRGEHNFTRHFEEFVRWTIPSSSQSVYNLQRYVFNSGAKGRGLSDVMENWDEAVANYDPEAVLFMPGPEDYNDDNFENALEEFINESLSLRGGAGYAVVLTPINDGSAESQALDEAVKQVLLTFKQSNDKNRICLVDIYETLGNVSTYYTSGGYLTEAGHFAIGERLCLATIGTTTNYPSSFDYRKNTGSRQVTELGQVPSVFSNVQPTATAGDGSLEVTVQGTEGPYSYELRLEDGVTVKGTAQSSPFTILGLPKSGDYTLITRKNGGNTQLVTVKGELAKGSTSTKDVQEVSSGSPQEKLQQAFADNKQMTWLFIGDSITHGSQHGHGYDSISELFDKFLEAADRGTDVVLNVGVSGAMAHYSGGDTWRSTIDNLDRRVYAFENSGLDVVTIQLGTNDGESPELYKGYIEDIMEAIWDKNANAIIILRSPTAAPGSSYSGKASRYAPSLQELAQQYSDRVIYEDQHTAVASAMSTYTWIIKDSKFIFGDANVHPGPVGHLVMLHQFLRACGIWTLDNPVTNLYYDILADTADNSDITYSAEDNHDGTHTLTASGSLGSECGEYTLTATSETGVKFSVTADSIDALALTVPDGEYTVTVSGAQQSAANRRTTRAAEVDASGTEEPVPEEPSAPTETDLNKVTVNVTCTNNFHVDDENKTKTFLLSSITSGGGAQVQNVIKGDGGGYTCQVMVDFSAYVNLFDSTHHIVDGEQNVTITFTYDNGTWTADMETVSIPVTCDATPALDLAAVNAGLTVVLSVDGTEQSYTLVDDDVTIGNVNSTETGFTAQVTFHPETIGDRYATSAGVTVSSSSADPSNVTFTYDTDAGTWTANPDTVTISIITAAETPEPPAPTPPAVVTPVVPTPGPGDVEIEDEETPLAGALPYEDVMMGDWFYDAAALLYNADVMTGVTETTFVPNASMTRGTVVTLLYRLENEPESGVNVFADVAPNIWYEDAVAWGAENGVVQGFSRTVFGPNRLITREQLAAILYRYAALKGYDTSARTNLLVFSDTSEIDAYAVTAMNWAVASGLLEGRGGKLLAPTGTATRAETAVILSRFINTFVNPEE